MANDEHVALLSAWRRGTRGAELAAFEAAHGDVEDLDCPWHLQADQESHGARNLRKQAANLASRWGVPLEDNLGGVKW